MKCNQIIGRERECRILGDSLEATTSQLIIVYGRRRVGKTFLINRYFENNFAFKVTGTYNQPKDFQLKTFLRELKTKSGNEKIPMVKDWLDAFFLLQDYLEKLDKSQKQVVFFDEMPWLDNQKSDFLPAFEWFWNNWANAQDNLVVILCGSATSWMDEKITRNKGGLFNRQTCKLVLKPFNLHETELFLKSKGINWSRYEITECYMIMGGIPYYLDNLSPRFSLRQNIDELFFKSGGALENEFNSLYATLFKNSPAFIKVVEALGKKPGGLTRKEIASGTGISENGLLSNILYNLELSGFIRISNVYRKTKKDAIYQLADYYTAFYLRFLKDNYGKDQHFWTNTIDNPSLRAWKGLTFEQVAKDHIPQIKQKLGISGVMTEESTWLSPSQEDTAGTQIDLIIDRRDNTVNLCEIKFSINEFTIDKDYEAKLRNKIASFSAILPKSKSIQLTMITTYGVKKNIYSGIFQNEVVLDDLFHEEL